MSLDDWEVVLGEQSKVFSESETTVAVATWGLSQLHLPCLVLCDVRLLAATSKGDCKSCFDPSSPEPVHLSLMCLPVLKLAQAV